MLKHRTISAVALESLREKKMGDNRSRSWTVVAGLGMLLLLGGLTRGTIPAENLVPHGLPQLRFPGCEAVVQPHKLLTLGNGIPEVHADSTGIDYFGHPLGLCYRFVVDISVPSDSRAAEFTPEFMLFASSLGFLNYDGSISASPLNCPKYVEAVQFYKRPSGAKDFVLLDGGSLRGRWTKIGLLGYSYSGCALTPELGWKPKLDSFNPPASGVDTYRIAVGVKFINQWLPVTAGATHMPNPE